LHFNWATCGVRNTPAARPTISGAGRNAACHEGQRHGGRPAEPGARALQLLAVPACCGRATQAARRCSACWPPPLLKEDNSLGEPRFPAGTGHQRSERCGSMCVGRAPPSSESRHRLARMRMRAQRGGRMGRARCPRCDSRQRGPGRGAWCTGIRRDHVCLSNLPRDVGSVQMS